MTDSWDAVTHVTHLEHSCRRRWGSVPAGEEAPCLLSQACPHTERSSSCLSMEGCGQLTARASPTGFCCLADQHCIGSLMFSGLQVEGWGYEAICVSASSGLGLTALAASLGSKVSVTAGPSGVGKSSIINALNASLRSERHPAAHAADDQAAAADEQIPGGLPLTCQTCCTPKARSLTSIEDEMAILVVEAGHEMSRSHARPPSGGRCPISRGVCTQRVMGVAQHAGAVSTDGGGVGSSDRPIIDSALGSHSLSSQLAVGDVSQIGRGRHTTRNVTLLPVAGGLLADTPGFNQPALEGVLPAELPAFFPEIQERTQQ